nr:MAG: hypothetical protein DIU56_05390 [Pseudomonadota bacterium]
MRVRNPYGRRDYETPHIDRLAREGVMLTHGYSNSPVCSATRCALITGRYQYRLPVELHEPPGCLGRQPRDPSGTPHASVAPARSRLRHLARRQVASREQSRARATAPRVRALLRYPRRRRGLLHARVSCAADRQVRSA